jgi:transaldolase
LLIFADSADIAAIRDLAQARLIDGVTTNPTLISRAGTKFLDLIAEIAEVVDGPVSAEVAGTDAITMMAEATRLRAIAPNVCVKLPLTRAGLQACHALNLDGAMTNVTLCFSLGQALVAARAGATFVSPFAGRLEDMNGDGAGLLRSIRILFDRHEGLQTKILAASLRSVNHITEAALIGCDAATAAPAVIEKLERHPLTDLGLEAFLSDWQASGQRILD